MSRSQRTEAEMIAALKQDGRRSQGGGCGVEVGVSKHTLYSRKAKYGGMGASQAQKNKQLRDEKIGCASWWRTCRWTRKSYSR